MGAGAMGRSRHIPSAAVGITAAIGQLAGDLIHELLARVSTLNFIISELTIVDRFLHRLARVGNSSALCKARGGKRFAPLGPATRGQVLHIHRHLGRSVLRGVRLGLARAAKNACSEETGVVRAQSTAHLWDCRACATLVQQRFNKRRLVGAVW